MATPGAEFASLGRKIPGKARDDAEGDLRDLEKDIVSNRDWTAPSLLKQVVERVSSITHAQGAAIAVCDRWGVTCWASIGDAPEVGSRLRPDSALTRECFESGQVVVCEDTESDYRVRRLTAQSLRLRSAVVVPLQNKGSVLGVIEVFSSRPSAFNITHVAGLQRIADLLAGILAPALLSPVQPAIRPAREDVLAVSSPVQSQELEEIVASLPAAALPEKPKSKVNIFLVAGAAILLLLLVWFSARLDPQGTTEPSARILPPVAVQGGGAAQPPSIVPESKQEQMPDSDGLVHSGHSPAAATFLRGSSSSGSSPKQSAEPILPVPEPVRELADDAVKGEAVQIIPGAVSAIVIQGAPPGTQIFVDDRLLASTNPTGQSGVSTIAAGRHHVRLRVNGYRDYDQDVDVEAGKTSTLTARLDPLELPTLREPAKSPVLAVTAAIPAPVVLARPHLPDFVLDRTLKAHNGWVTSVAFSPEGGRLASGSWDRTVKFWKVSTGEQLGIVTNKMKEVQSLAFSRDGLWLATENSSDTTSLRDPLTGQEIRTLPSDKPLGPLGSNWVYSIAFSPDGRWLASAIDDKTVRLWDVTTGQKVRDLTGLRRAVVYIAFSPDGRLLATGDDQKNIRIWDAASGEEIYKLSGHKKSVYAVAFSPDGRWLASASADKTVKVWDLATGHEAHTLAGHGDVVTSLAFSPDGHWLVSGSWDKTVKIWDVEAGREVQTLAGHEHPVYSVAFDSRGRWLASGSEDGTIKLWRLGGPPDQGGSPR